MGHHVHARAVVGQSRLRAGADRRTWTSPDAEGGTVGEQDRQRYVPYQVPVGGPALLLPDAAPPADDRRAPTPWPRRSTPASDGGGAGSRGCGSRATRLRRRGCPHRSCATRCGASGRPCPAGAPPAAAGGTLRVRGEVAFTTDRTCGIVHSPICATRLVDPTRDTARCVRTVRGRGHDRGRGTPRGGTGHTRGEGKTGATGTGRCATMRGGTAVPRGTRTKRCARGGAVLVMVSSAVGRKVEMSSTPASGGRREGARRKVVTADPPAKSTWG